MSSKNELRQKLLQLSKEVLVDLVVELIIRVEKLEAKLNFYENPHTPSSQPRFKPETKKEPDQDKPRFPGAPLNHKGAGIRLPKPDKVIEHKLNDKKLKLVGKYTRTVIEFVDKPIEVIEHIIYQYKTKDGRIIEPEVDLPDGIYGKHLQVFLSELKTIGGISYEKMSNLVKALRSDISICPATILSLIDKVAENLEQPRKNILQKLRKSLFVQADETGMRQDGENGYVWAFCNPDYALYEFDPTRARAVAERVLGNNFLGYTVNDGYNAYGHFKHQRCWVHILREADALEENYSEVSLQVKLLHEMYDQATIAKGESLDKRREVIEKLSGQTELGHVIEVMKVTEGCKKFSGTLRRALPHLFVGVEHPEIPLHNNFAERTIRPVVVHRKMMGCIRNEKGKRLINNLLSMMQTWKLQGKPIHKMLLRYAN